MNNDPTKPVKFSIIGSNLEHPVLSWRYPRYVVASPTSDITEIDMLQVHNESEENLHRWTIGTWEGVPLGPPLPPVAKTVTPAPTTANTALATTTADTALAATTAGVTSPVDATSPPSADDCVVSQHNNTAAPAATTSDSPADGPPVLLISIPEPGMHGLDFLKCFDAEIAAMDNFTRVHNLVREPEFKARVRKGFRFDSDEAAELRDTGLHVKIAEFDPDTSTAVGGPDGIERMNAEITSGGYKSIIVLQLNDNYGEFKAAHGTALRTFVQDGGRLAFPVPTMSSKNLLQHILKPLFMVEWEDGGIRRGDNKACVDNNKAVEAHFPGLTGVKYSGKCVYLTNVPPCDRYFVDEDDATQVRS